MIASAVAKRAARAKRRPPSNTRARVLALRPLPLLLPLHLLRPPLLLALLAVAAVRRQCVIVAPASRRAALFCRWRASRAPAVAAVVAIIAMILSWWLICAICSIVPQSRPLQLLPRHLRLRLLVARHPLRPLAVVQCLVLASRSSLQRCRRRRLVVPMESVAVLVVAATAAVVAMILPALIRISILTSMMVALPPVQVRVRTAVRSPTVGRVLAVAMVPILVWRSQNAISGVPLPGA